MSLSDIAAIGSLVSGLAVLVSLIYLAQQTRQNSKHTTLIQQGRAQRAWEFNMRMADASTSNAKVWLMGQRADVAMSEELGTQFLGLCRAAFIAHEDSFRQHAEGLFRDAAYEGTVRVMKNRLSSPGMRAAWRVWRETFDPDFRAQVDDLLAATPAQPPSHSVLNEAFAAELRALVGGSSSAPPPPNGEKK